MPSLTCIHPNTWCYSPEVEIIERSIFCPAIVSPPPLLSPHGGGDMQSEYLVHRATPDPPKWTRAFYFYGPVHHLDWDNAAGWLLAPAASGLKLFIEFMSLGQPAPRWRHSRLSSDLQWLRARVTAGSLLPSLPTIPLIYPRYESSQESVSGLQMCASTWWKTSQCPKYCQNLLSKCQYS